MKTGLLPATILVLNALAMENGQLRAKHNIIRASHNVLISLELILLFFLSGKSSIFLGKSEKMDLIILI